MSTSLRCTALALAAILALTAVACGGGGAETEGTAAETTVETTAATAGGVNTSPTETAAETVAETTAARTEPLDIDSLLAGYQLHQVVSEELDDFRNTFPKDDVLGKIAVEVTDMAGLFILIEDEGITNDYDSGRLRANVHRIICGQTVQDCEIAFYFGGPEGFELFRADGITVVQKYGYYSYSYIFHEDGCTHIPTGSGRDGGSPLLYLEEGALMYRTVNPKYMMVQTQYSMLDVVEDENDWYNEWGTVTVENGEVIMTKTGEQLVCEDYDIRETFYELKAQTDEYTLSQDFMMFDTFDELLEYNRLKARVGEAEALLSVIPVYEVTYEDDHYLDILDTVGEEEYRKFAAGEAYSKLYAIRFTEYPDAAIIGQVNTDVDSEYCTAQRGINSVIWNGVRYYTPKYDSGPGFGVNITEDFVCITAGACGYGDAYYVYDGGVEYHTYPNSEIGTSMYILNESGGVMKYMWYSPQYSLAIHYSGALYENYKSPDDHLYDRGTVQLIDGKIEYVADESYTVSEWFASDTYLQEKSGCTTIEEFLVWFKDYNNNGEWGKEYIHVP